MPDKRNSLGGRGSRRAARPAEPDHGSRQTAGDQPGPTDGQSPLVSLTPRERKVATLFVETLGDTKAIARQLKLAKPTVRNHLTSIEHKLQAHSRQELFAILFRAQSTSQNPPA
jgi:DNA-binding CsgD family transcriptional regulator